MKKTKKHIWVPIGFILLFITAFLGSMVFWNTGLLHSEAEDATEPTKVIATDNSVKDFQLLTVDTTFYNYRYDREIYDNKRDQGAQSCYDDSGIPFTAFDKKLSTYYNEQKVTSGIYTGNFYHYYGGLPGNRGVLSFPGYKKFYWAANIANRTSPYNSVCQGLVSNTLSAFTTNSITENDVTTGTLVMATDNGSVAVPYFDKGFLENTTANGVAIGAVKEHVGFPFRKVTSGSKKGYYEFDSEKDVVRFDGMTGYPTQDSYYFGTNGQLQYFYNTKQVYSAAASGAQFLPFNNSNQSGVSGISNEQKALDYGFGVRYNIPFRLSEDGKVDGKPMVFEFSGDDDVWIFLDGKLALDLGGQHGKATGTIDFSTSGGKATSTVARVTRVSRETTATSNKILAEDTYIEENVSSTIEDIAKGADNLHVITVFYMERGMFESNFHMAFNFVPENAPTPAPTPTVTPKAAAANGTLKIQNKLVLPTINPAFLQTVKNLAEEDVFSYTIQNQGTKRDYVGDSGIYYPSGVLTVRQNTDTTAGKTTASNPVKSYLSFGAQSKIRIYFDIGNLENYIHRYTSYTSFSIPKYDDGIALKVQVDYHISGKDGWETAICRFEKYNADGIYYGDFNAGIDKMHFQSQDWPRVSTNGDLTLDTSLVYDGALFSSGNNFNTSENQNIKIDSVLWTQNIYPKLGGGETYSNTLPSKAAGEVKKFAPSDENSFNNVADTSYTLTEAYPAPTDANILVNSTETSGITDASGIFDLFHDDSATFLKQFAKASKMKVVQNNALMQPKRYSNSGSYVPSSSVSVSDALTTFVESSTFRKGADYYYTTVSAESKNESTTASIDVSYDGQYTFDNGGGIAENDPVNITQTFTNTVKTGSLTISKKLKGNANKDSEYIYTYTVNFSDVFGGDSTSTAYTGTYELTDATGSTSTQNANSGTISLHPGESAKISGIPVGTKYSIVESVATGDSSVVSEIKAVYKATLEDSTITSPTYKETSGITNIDKTTRTIEGVIPCSITNKAYGTDTTDFQTVDVTVTYTNLFGSMTITKKVAGDVNEANYYKPADAGADWEKEYKFKVEKNSTAIDGNYKVNTYTYPNGYNNDPVVTSTTKSVESGGIITLKEGQEAEICEIPLGDSSQYTITEQIDDNDIYYVEKIKVTEGADANGEKSLSNTNFITTQAFSDANPAFRAVFTNRYSNSYIEIDKYVDALYYGSRNYADGLTYQTLTDANQGFVFEIEQYETLEKAQTGNTDSNKPEKTYEVVVYLGNDAETLETAITKTFDSTSINFPYKVSQKVKVLGNRYYRIKEKTDWAWKYNFLGAQATLPTSLSSLSGLPTGLSTIEGWSITDGKEVILKSYLDSTAIPIAEFYNQMDEEKNDIDGDTDSAVNKLYKDGTIIDE